jgi:diguanylate cyclase (GGDEF)-like protein/PAS domain S-box-containing protein
MTTAADAHPGVASGAPPISYEFDSRGTFTAVSDALCDVLGWRREELVGTFAPSLVHPEDRGRLVQQGSAFVAGRDSIDPVWRVRHASGEYRWYRVRVTARRDADGAVAGASAVLDDVDQAEAAREALVENERRYRLLVQNSADVVIHHVGGIVRWISPSVTALTGWTPDEVIGHHSLDLWHPDDRETAYTIRRDASIGRPQTAVLRLRHKDGHYLHVDAAVHGDGSGEDQGVVVTLRDASARVAALEALEAREAEFRLIAENAADMVVLSDLHGTVEWVSPSIRRLLGIEPADMLGRSLVSLLHPDDAAAREEAMAQTDADAASYFEARYRRPGGDYIWLGAHIRPVHDEFGNVVARLGSAREVEREVEARHALEAREAEYRLLAENAADVVFRIDAEDRFAWLSPSVEQVLGRRPEDLLGQPAASLLHPDDVAVRQRAIQDIDGLGRTSFEVRYRHADGSYHWLAISGHPLVDADGNQVGRVGNARQIDTEVQAREALRRSEAEFRLLAQNSADVVVRSRVDGAVEWVSPSISTVLGWNPDELVGRDFLELLHPDDRAQRDAGRSSAAHGTSSSFLARYQHKSGDWVWMSVTGAPIVDESGDVVGVAGSARDASVEVAAREALEASEEMFHTVMDSSTVGMAVLGLDLSFRAVNPALCRLSGYDEAWFATHSAPDLAAPERRELAASVGPSYFAGRTHAVTDVVRLLRADGAVISVRRTTILIRDAAGEPDYLVAQLQDITAELELEYRTFHDALTGLRNRTWIVDILEEELRVARRNHRGVGVLFIDLDNFKVVNDSLGHAAGDEVLSTVGKRLTAAMRPGDHVGRFGGDEFVVVIPEIEEVPDLERICERVLGDLTPPLDVQGHRISPTASMGVAVSTPDSSAQSLLRDADSALYRAKSAGKHRWHFADEAMHAQAVSRLTTEDELRRALAEHELVVHYQPIVRLSDRVVVAHEALVRWQHPTRGLVPPLDFLPVAEESGLIVEIGDEVMRLVCEMLSARPDLANVSVNLSPVQTSRPWWREKLVGCLTEHGVAPSRVSVEVTETAVLDNADDVAQELTSLRALGIGVHLDDFGTGYSSIALLRDLPISGLKLDMSFTRRLTGDGGTTEVLAAGLAQLASGLGMIGIAEGVETEEQAALLRAMGWTHGQGWLFGRPAPEPV